MKITICGSMQHDPAMSRIAQSLAALGYEVEKPNVVEGHVYSDNLDANATLKQRFIDEHFRKIDDSDAVLVVNEEKNGIAGYIGGNTLIEIAHAYAQGLEVFLLHSIPAVSSADEIRGMHPIVLDGDLGAFHAYFQELPLLMVSSENVVKHRAISRGLRRAGIRTRVEGIAVASGVNDQPTSIEESYEGATNRHEAPLVKATKKLQPQFLATIESGYHRVHKDHNSFGCTALVIEKVGGERHIGIDLDIEFPREMTDRIPKDYPDIGLLVQKEYGATAKDPFPYFTHGKLTRAKILEDAVYNVAVRF